MSAASKARNGKQLQGEELGRSSLSNLHWGKWRHFYHEFLLSRLHGELWTPGCCNFCVRSLWYIIQPCSTTSEHDT